MGGAWSTGAPGTASVNTSGTVSGLSAGNANITYTLPTGCRSSVAVVVNPLPNAITGALSVCVNATTTLNNSSAGGMWNSGNTSVASINSSGVVTGVAAGMSAITYTLPTGCIRTTNVNINPLPAPISGVLNVCQGLTTALGNSSPGGTWSSSASGTASVNAIGVVSGVSVGTANITYTLPTSCRIAASVVVNSLPAAITGNTQVCAGSTTTLSNTTINGSWSTSSPSIATVDGSGTVGGITAGTAVITYTLPTGCYKTTVVNVNPLPLAIVGSTSVCQGLATGLSNASGGGTWSSSNGTIAPVSGAGVVNGIAPGITVISYTLPTGCASTLVMAVDPTPAVITGSGTVCAGSTTMMSTTTSGGFWGSASEIASVSFLGEVSGMSAGTATITYILPSGCFRTRQITVNALPATITGSDNVCVGSQTTLSSTSAGGTWNSNSEPHALINAATGEISGVSAGTMLISYTLPTTCMRVRMITVNTTPAAITGSMEICNGGVTTLNTTSTGGVWISGTTSVAIVGLAGGNVTGLSAGTSSISYTMPTGCMTSTVVTVNANPGSIMGITSICHGSSTVLSNASLGGMWSISAPSVADISGAGVLSGISAGNAIVTYTLPSGCNTTATIAVNALPATANVTGGGSYCAGGAGVNLGLDGSDALTTYKLYRGTTLAGTYSGTGAPIHFGTFTNAGMYMVTATSASGCNSNMSGSAVITITPVVTPVVSVSSSAGDTVCAGTMVTYNVMATNGGTTPGYEWKVNGVVMSGSGSSYDYTPNDGDVVSVTVNSSATCAIPATVTGVKLMKVMNVATPSISISVGPSASVCKGTMAMFTATAVNGGTTPVYTWMKNGVTPMGTGATLSYAPNDNDVVVCWLNSSYRCPSVNNVVSPGITMNVDEVYIPEVQIVASPGTSIKAGQTATFTTTVTNAGASPTYKWLKNGVVISGAVQSMYSTSNLADGDSVTCIVKGSGTCGEETINSVVMSVAPTTGITTTVIGGSDIRLMPNPNNGTFTVSGTLSVSSTERVNLEVTDMLGQVVYRTAATATNGVLNEQILLSNNMANGMYLLNISIGAERKALHFVVRK
jgi:trimeric autotransporter adhesin